MVPVRAHLQQKHIKISTELVRLNCVLQATVKTIAYHSAVFLPWYLCQLYSPRWL